jgi:beta-N-acetylhexosaminidase
MSRALLHDLLRGELGFEGMVMTDALEMKAISATVGVEEGAVRAIAAGADALCLGHDLFDASVVAVRDALVAAVRSGRLAEERLVEAAGRVEKVAAWRASADAPASVDRAVGKIAARRALHVDGPVPLSRPALAVELEPEAGLAAGPLGRTPAEWFCSRVPDAVSLRFREGAVDTGVELDARQLVIIARDAHRHAWQRDAIDALTARAPDAAVVEVGLPHWRPAGAGTYVATFGAARVNVEAAAERLYSSERRGVEQSGSSPGS